MVLPHPYFRGKELVPSEGTDPNFLRREERTWGFVSGGRYGMDHPFINPLALPAAEWAKLGCRRALVTVAELDAMRDRGRRYVEAPRGSAWAGVEAALYETEGERHVYFIDKSAGAGEKAKREMAAVVSFIEQQG
ncbi:tuliposide A-converting enzyme 1, chloroplastic-like [Panicum miliaceum]|uniref:Tuliposide A-converting enzyme 1, chloroplastic-like n=1 Tax=Panicum miliaceum TaxID=4540 RepID=A0A3L6RIT6_PANMI|nr:tuliposide A-converting enzyme 1, chloroplastic-like [Panicum miliaceum]